MNRRFAADLIFTSEGKPIRKGWIETTTEGRIISIHSDNIPMDAEYSEGIIVPGFINAHCHLELSHLRGRITEKQGMAEFIRSLLSQRFQATESERITEMMSADNEMYENGIVAVGDISNFNLSLKAKENSKIYYHTFIEILGLDETKAEEILSNGKSLIKMFSSGTNERSGLVPHAPYSVSDLLFELLSKEYKNSPVTIHMEESEDEYNFCQNKSGNFAELFDELKINYSSFKAVPDQSPLIRILAKLKDAERIQFVHNTYTKKDEIESTSSIKNKIYWCLCPNANIYINNILPDFNLFNNDDLNVTIGTDSLASNKSLNIIDEIKAIQKNNGSISFERLIRWSTINGAKFLGIDKTFGSIVPGKTPGLVSLQNINPDSLIINPKTTIKRLI